MSIRSERASRRGRVCAASVAVLAVALSSLGASAQHQAYDPRMRAAFNDQPDVARAVDLTFDQADGQAPTVDVVYRMPREWQFSFKSLRPAHKPAPFGSPPGTVTPPATSCSDLMTVGTGRLPQEMSSAEVIGWPYVRGEIDATRSGVDTNRVDLSQAGTGPGRSPGTPYVSWGDNSRFGIPGSNRLGFLNWDDVTQTARVCLYLYTDDGRLDRQNGATWDYSARTHLFEGRIRLTADAWELSFDLRSFYRNPHLQAQHLMITSMLLHISPLSSGKWNPAPVTVSSTPMNTGVYARRGQYQTCHLDSSVASLPCAAGSEQVVNITQTFRIGLVEGIVHPFARLTRPANMSIVNGSSEVRVTWRQAAAPFGHTVKGYVLAVSYPGDESSRHFVYEITDPELRVAAGEPWQTNPCGNNGDREECEILLRFPMTSTISGKMLSLNRKLSFSLVTVYRDGHRTDERCDDGSALGVACAPADAGFVIERPGFSASELFITARRWPAIFFDPGSLTTPTAVLFVDFTAKRGQFVVWNTGSPYEQIYVATSNHIVGDDATGGVVSFSSALDANSNWAFNGVTAATAARGMLTTFDLKGMPAPSGQPTAASSQFNGTKVAA